VAEGSDQEDRTEDPTPKRIEDAIKRGNVANSQEINTLFILAAFTLVLMIAAGPIARGLFADMRGLLGRLHDIPSDPVAYVAFGRRALVAALVALAVPLAAVVAASLAGGRAQHPFLWTTDPLGPQWSRVSPMAGFKRLFGLEAVLNLVKGLVKVLLVGIVAGAILWFDRDRLEASARIEPAALLPVTLGLSLRLLAGVLAAYAVIALADGLYQRFQWRRQLRMTKQEIKEEAKESDGNPEIKGRIRQLRLARVRKRMMAAVPTATVIVTNPTHFAVALRYESGMGAPLCVAKGVDALALRIREVAGEHDVPIVENPPLARALHATVEIDETIPEEHYRAVAEVIGFVLRTRRR
jgi:flagellar biosynthetic protein FlhB